MEGFEAVRAADGAAVTVLDGAGHNVHVDDLPSVLSLIGGSIQEKLT